MTVAIGTFGLLTGPEIHVHDPHQKGQRQPGGGYLAQEGNSIVIMS